LILSQVYESFNTSNRSQEWRFGFACSERRPSLS
jgi:hypothetical protein